MNIIRQVVGRCHVAYTNRQVIRYVISTLRHKEITFWSMPKSQRKLFMQQCVKEHEANIKLYVDVQNGRF